MGSVTYPGIEKAHQAWYSNDKSRSGETGRRAGLKIQWGQPRAGSSPASGTR